MQAQAFCAFLHAIAGSACLASRTKRLPARLHGNTVGRKPVRAWILELPKADRYVIGKDIQTVEFGRPLGRPHCAPLGEGLWEVRSSLTGDRIARVISCMRSSSRQNPKSPCRSDAPPRVKRSTRQNDSGSFFPYWLLFSASAETQDRDSGRSPG
jgi:hypothetical protein